MSEGKEGGDNMTHTWGKHIERQRQHSLLSLFAFLLKHNHAHWISFHSSWLETPMAVAGGIHSPWMLWQLFWYRMKHSWSCLSLNAVRDKEKEKKKKKTTCYSIPNPHHQLPKCTQLISSCPHFPKPDLNFCVFATAYAWCPPPSRHMYNNYHFCVLWLFFFTFCVLLWISNCTFA